MKSLKHINKYFAKYKKLLVFGIIFITVSNIFAILPAQFVRQSIDSIVGDASVIKLFDSFDLYQIAREHLFEAILIFGVLILVSAMIRGFFLYLTRQTVIVMSRLVEYDLKNEIYDHYQKLPLSFYRKNNTGDLMNRISEDVSRVRMYVGPAIMYGINLIVLFLLVISYMVSVNAELTLYVLLPLPILSLSIYYVSNKINRQSESIQRSMSGLSTYVQEAFSGIRVIKSFAREEESSQAFNRESDQYKKKSLKLAMTNSLFFPLIMGLIGLSTIMTIYIGGIQVMEGKVSIGNIAEFVIYVNMLTWPVTSLGWVTSIVQRAAASQERINEFLDTKSDIVSKEKLTPELKGEIEFKNVSLTYGDSGIKALDNISFSVQPGKTLAIVGTTGSGKSTIAALMTRSYDVTEGEIRIDNYPISHLDTAFFRSNIGVVPQDVFLFSETIGNNIRFGADNASDEDVIEAAKNAYVHHNIMDFETNYKSMVGERGITLSGGQKQRVSIARALIRNPKILILDDCLSAVDTKTEDTILNNLDRVMKNKTSVIISHRVSSVKLADSIIVLDEGKIVEQGTHEDLIDKKGVYFELYEMQQESEN